MPYSTRSNKESQLIFQPDPASLERMIRKEESSLSTDNNNSVSLDSAQPPSTQTPVPSTYSRSPLSIDNRNLPSTDTLHPTSIDIPSRTSIDIPSRTSINTESRAMVAPLILVWDNNGDLHDQECHLRNAAGTCPAVPEATRNLNCYSHQILQVSNARSVRKRAPYRSTTTTTVDPDTSPIDRFSLTPVERQHKASVNQ
ncbi:hypothetical protein DY000_02007659 [Brassica cretica]|uniref:Uncharacterized protein n=1 Tax=Brassica cretica TaxID=69181 RepID=A0ABQ7CD76_BRACR|nr:hypothetical protein DY000_02007659 [Brassica cretica]